MIEDCKKTTRVSAEKHDYDARCYDFQYLYLTHECSN